MSVLVINDLAGTGKVAGSINIAILSAAGFEVTFLPTCLLTHHTGSGPIYKEIIIDYFQQALAAWENVAFELIVTGYFSSVEQLRNFTNWYDQLAVKPPLIVDPVMADNDKLYSGFDERYVEVMKSLCQLATLVLPNQTEATFLFGNSLPESVIVTGIEVEGKIGVLLSNGDLMAINYQPGHFYGTGDAFTSLIAAGYMKQFEVEATLNFALKWLNKAVYLTRKVKGDSPNSLLFEPLTNEITQFFGGK